MVVPPLKVSWLEGPTLLSGEPCQPQGGFSLLVWGLGPASRLALAGGQGLGG